MISTTHRALEKRRAQLYDSERVSNLLEMWKIDAQSKRAGLLAVPKRDWPTEAVLRFWLGHASVKSVSDVYDRTAIDEQFRSDKCDRIGLGFALPR